MTRDALEGSGPESAELSDADRMRLLDRLASFGLAENQPPLFVSTDLAKRRPGRG
jgi:hypothetical protein